MSAIRQQGRIEVSVRDRKVWWKPWTWRTRYRPIKLVFDDFAARPVTVSGMTIRNDDHAGLVDIRPAAPTVTIKGDGECSTS